jgi:hypothetical protein
MILRALANCASYASVSCIVITLLTSSVLPALGAPITIDLASLNNFRTTRSLNDVGIRPQGDGNQFGAHTERWHNHAGRPGNLQR